MRDVDDGPKRRKKSCQKKRRVGPLQSEKGTCPERISEREPVRPKYSTEGGKCNDGEKQLERGERVRGSPRYSRFEKSRKAGNNFANKGDASKKSISEGERETSGKKHSLGERSKKGPGRKMVIHSGEKKLA